MASAIGSGWVRLFLAGTLASVALGLGGWQAASLLAHKEEDAHPVARIKLEALAGQQRECHEAHLSLQAHMQVGFGKIDERLDAQAIKQAEMNITQAVILAEVRRLPRGAAPP